MYSDDIDYAIPTIIAREVKGETPQWYDPNGYHRYAKVVNASTGESFLIDVDRATRLDLRNVDRDQIVTLLKQYASVQNSDPTPLSTGDRTMAGTTPNRIIRQVIRDNYHTQPDNGRMRSVSTVSQPQHVVEFRLVGVPAKFTCYYLDILMDDRYLILVQDTEAIVGQQIELDPGAEVKISIPTKNIAGVSYTALGLNFDYEGRRFSILVKSESLLDDEPRFPEVQARGEPDPEVEIEEAISALERKLSKSMPGHEVTNRGSEE